MKFIKDNDLKKKNSFTECFFHTRMSVSREVTRFIGGIIFFMYDTLK